MRSRKHACRGAHPASAPQRIRAGCTVSMTSPGRAPRSFSVTLDGPSSVLCRSRSHEHRPTDCLNGTLNSQSSAVPSGSLLWRASPRLLPEAWFAGCSVPSRALGVVVNFFHAKPSTLDARPSTSSLGPLQVLGCFLRGKNEVCSLPTA
jgi:hypothetical protein